MYERNVEKKNRLNLKNRKTYLLQLVNHQLLLFKIKSFINKKNQNLKRLEDKFLNLFLWKIVNKHKFIAIVFRLESL